MNLVEMTDEEILKIANPIWNGLVESSNKKDYGGFTKHFSKEMLFGALLQALIFLKGKYIRTA